MVWCGASWDDNDDECMICIILSDSFFSFSLFVLICTILSDSFFFFFSLCMIDD